MAKGVVKVNKDFCKSCGLCVSVCPAKILAIDSDEINTSGYYPVTVKDMDKCIACANCAKICPDIALTIGKIK